MILQETPMPNWATLLDTGVVQRQQSLAKYTAARLGGESEYFFLARADESLERLAEVVQIAWSEGIPVRVIGGGANVLISDAGVQGLVVVNRISQIEWGSWHEGRNVSATSGTGLLKLARACQQQGLAGMSWAIGVPGTVGGAIVNNAGAHGSDMAASVADVVVLSAERGAQLMTNADMQFDYRHSILKAHPDKRFLVLLATMHLMPDDPDAIQERMDTYSQRRKATQPAGASLGSIFKNPEGDYAGRLIESAGLKGFHIGDAMVSPVHANFMINRGQATASDYYALIQHVREAVYKRHGMMLDMEVELLGQWSVE
jgi:UDP-N-acetylmuramate dehydrogenase